MQTLFAEDFAVLPDTGEDSTAQVASLLSQNPADVSFVFKPGRYDFYSDKAIKRAYYLSNTDVVNPRNLSVLLENMCNVILDGQNSYFVFHGQTMPFTVDACRNVTLKNLTIDWDIPLTAEGTVENATTQYADIKIDDALFPYAVENGTLYFQGENWKEPVWDWGHTEFDAHTQKVAYRSGDTFPKTTQALLPTGAVRFYGNFLRPMTVGNTVVLRHNRRMHAGVFLVNSQNVTIENITVHCTGGLGILAQFCEDLCFRRVRMLPNFLRGRKMISGHDDGLHLCCNSGHVLVEECYFRGLMDDPLNLHGITTRITKIENSHTVRGEFVHPQAMGFDLWASPGHQVSAMRKNDMACLATCTVKCFRLLTPQIFTLTLETPLPRELAVGDSLENLTRTASLTCRNNYFGNCRARGILVTTPKPVLVEHNVFESAGAAVLIAGDAMTWYESGNCSDVVIRDNYFGESCLTSQYDGGDAVVSIHPEVDTPNPKRPFHKNICITGNTFQTSDAPILYAFCTQNVRFSNNNIVRSHAYTPWHQQTAMLAFAYCSNVAVNENRLIGDVLEPRISLIGMEAHEVVQSGETQLPITRQDENAALS